MEKPICTFECEDCGVFAVTTCGGMTVFAINKEFFAISRCVHCQRVMVDTCSKQAAVHLFWNNVKIFSFNTGEEIMDQSILEKL